MVSHNQARVTHATSIQRALLLWSGSGAKEAAVATGQVVEVVAVVGPAPVEVLDRAVLPGGRDGPSVE